MPRSLFRSMGLVPGSLEIPDGTSAPVIDLVTYGPDSLNRRRITDVSEISPELGKEPVTWVDVNGLGDAEILCELAAVFGFHKLSLEDVVQLDQRPKVEEYDGYLFVVLQFPVFEGGLNFEQICMYVGSNYVVTFQATAIHRLSEIMERIVESRGRIREAPAGYLSYAIMDTIVDAFFPLLEKADTDVEEIEASIIESINTPRHREIYQLKRELLAVRWAMWGARDVFNELIRDHGHRFEKETQLYLRDAYDHSLRIVEMAEGLREACSGLMDLYMSIVSNRMNEIMKVLTIMASIFIPITFIAGIYGMNFDHESSTLNMPELFWEFGYLTAIGLMALIAGSMLFWFYRRGWIGKGKG